MFETILIGVAVVAVLFVTARWLLPSLSKGS
jgi:hypothetical protein